MSKQCCPACWELIQLLQERSGTSDYNVYSYHSTVFPVQLPPGLPIDVLVAMTKKFEVHLDRELSLLQKKRLEGSDVDDTLSRHPSRQSVGSNISDRTASSVLTSVFPGVGLNIFEKVFKTD